MMRVGLFVELTARPGKEDAVAAFLAGAREAAVEESQTLAWFAFHLEGSRFAIFDCFDNDAGRNAHLSGPIAAALTVFALGYIFGRLGALMPSRGSRRARVL